MTEKEIIVYPNPSNGGFSISLFNTTEVEILNQEGVLLERRYLAPGENAVDA